MNTLSIGIIRAILLHTEVGSQLADLALVCRQFSTVPSSDGGIQSLDEALKKAVDQNHLECVDTILNDRLGRVTQQAKDTAFLKCVHKRNLPMPALLIQHSISPQALNEALFISVKQSWTELQTLLLKQSDVDPDYQNGVCLDEAVIQDNQSVLQLLLDDARVSISANDYRALRKAMRLRLSGHTNLFLEAAKRLNDEEVGRLVNECYQRLGPKNFAHALLMEINGTANGVEGLYD
ncbi:hypothetical protein BJ741DRAFT_44691 [Chytriomyces cf. hyalinus JEL632]|nr:hypothetical protein BJ741DRAFT_44691 [Chytriomyces cf. hyalinus JEL632]